MINEVFPGEIELVKNLTKRELKYWRIIRTNSGVLNLVGKPGLSKTSTLRALAKKLNLYYVDMRLTTKDETDLGCYPLIKEINGFSVINYAIPDWAWEANGAKSIVNTENSKKYNGSLIVFEELNRANITLRNAALQILLEKEIGTKFKFNTDVFMAATGNLGVDDNTDVEEFDLALKTRLVRVLHDLKFQEWYKEFGKENVHNDILEFIKNNPSHYYPDFKNEDSETATNPRTWTFLSDFIVKNYGKNSIFNDYYQEISEIGSSYINLPDLLEFLRFTKERYLITYEDILNNKNNIISKEKIKSLDRDVSSRILNELKELNVNDFSKKQINNLVNFLNLLEAEQKISYLYDLLSDIKYDNIDYKEDRKSNLTYIIEVFDKEKEIIFNKIPEIS
jgi:hypothetical protein